MAWKLIEVPEVLGDTFTDDEIISLYTLVSYGSANYHKDIKQKMEKIAKAAAYNLQQEHHWENEGGAPQETGK